MMRITLFPVYPLIPRNQPPCIHAHSKTTQAKTKMPAVETFKNVPELFEGVYEESIKIRTETMNTFKQLGPDDLVHVVKNIPNSRQQIKEVSSYHFVIGVDTSSSASIAAYINTLTYSLSSQQKWTSGSPGSSGNSWNISKCTFCAFNAFAGSDVRVEARIPGGVKSYTVDVLGSRRGTDPEGWQETFLSSILRTLKSAGVFNDDESQDSELVRREVDGMLFSLQTEMKFLESATKLFPRGRQLGRPLGPHLAGNHDNFLTLGLVGYFCKTGRPEIAIGFLKGFAEKDPSLNGLLMKCYILSNNQHLAMKMITTPSCTPHVYPQLADFLLSRGDLEKADHFASESLKCFPNDFRNWRRLIQIKIARGQVEKALAILNNAPMMTAANGDGEFYKSLPKPVLISLPGIEQSNTQSQFNQQSVLEKLKAPGLKGTFRAAYELLIEIYRAVGWDALLEFRSKVFIMERELLCESERNELNEKDNMDVQTDASESPSLHNPPIKSPLNEPVQLLSLPDTNFLSQTGKKLCERWLDNLILILFEDLRIFALFTEELKQQVKVVQRGVKEWYLLGRLARRLGHLEESKLAYQKCLFSSSSSSSSSKNTLNTNTPNTTVNTSLNYDQLKMVNSALTDLIQIYCKEGRAQLSILCTLRLLNTQKSLYSSLLHPTQTSFDLCGLVERVGIKRIECELRNGTGTEGESEGKKRLEEFLEFIKNAKVHGYNY